MKNLTNKLTSAISGAVLFVAAIAMAGLGFVALGTLALFAFIALGVALLAVPFAKMNHDASHDADTVETTV